MKLSYALFGVWIALFVVWIALSAGPATAGEGDWMFFRGDFTHDPASGRRVAQFAPIPPVYYPYAGDYTRSGYRYTNSSLRVGESVDRYTRVETWGNGALALGSALLWDPVDYRRGVYEDQFDRRDRYRRRSHEWRGLGAGRAERRRGDECRRRGNGDALGGRRLRGGVLPLSRAVGAERR